MKVVDMFGAGLPVAGFSGYESWVELVREGENGRGFETIEQLRDILIELFGERGAVELRKLKDGAIEEGRRRWDEEWDGVAGRLLGLTD
jgi:beta-1,4-mannosyltransferase